MSVATDDSGLLGSGQRLLSEWGIRHLLITLGEAGMILLEDEKAPYRIPARDVYDVSGAGDTAITLFTSPLCAGFESIFSAEISNCGCGAGVVVGKLGTATIGPEELLRQIERLDSP